MTAGTPDAARAVTSGACPVCGETYDEFRTGLRFHDVYRSMWVYSDEPSEWRYKRRHSVLGHWREQKMRQFQDYHIGCLEQSA